jgi:acetate kinase
MGRPAVGLRLVTAHLGNGASVTAVRDGMSVDTSMGFTPLEGLMMGTRSGSIDPGLLLYLQKRCGVRVDDLDRALNHESGLLGVSGLSSDMRTLMKESEAGNARASLAVRMFAHRARQAIGALAVTLGGADALVFTGGIGEHSPQVRAAICDGLSALGFELDGSANQSARPDCVVSTPASPGRIFVLTAREDVEMARAAMSCLEPSRARHAAS